MSPLRITHLSHNDRKGGGPLACYRLHRALADLKVESRMLVLERQRGEASIADLGSDIMKEPIRLADRLPLRLYRKRLPDRIWSPGCFGMRGLENHPMIAASDVLGLYWVNGGLLSVGGIRRLLGLDKPVVWRLSDLWPFTGGCHHPGDCTRFETDCGSCPQLGSKSATDLSARQLRQKKTWPRDHLTVVAPSRWILDLAARSAVFRKVRLRHITTGVDVDVFKPARKAEARQKLGLPPDRRLILFGANNAIGNARKGFPRLVEALDHLAKTRRFADVDLVLFGCDTAPALPLDFPVHTAGVIRDEARMALLYAAADIFVTPSLEENLPNTVIEAMASGTPAVAFDVGGTGELIEHGENGFLATLGDSRELARGMESVLEDAAEGAMGRRAREAMITRHDQRLIAKRYLDLYDELLGERHSPQRPAA